MESQQGQTEAQEILAREEPFLQPVPAPVNQLELNPTDHGEEHETDQGEQVSELCDYCHQGFSSSWALQRHIQKEHHGKKKYACSGCEKQFTTKHAAQQHLAVQHQGTGAITIAPEETDQAAAASAEVEETENPTLKRKTREGRVAAKRRRILSSSSSSSSELGPTKRLVLYSSSSNSSSSSSTDSSSVSSSPERQRKTRKHKKKPMPKRQESSSEEDEEDLAWNSELDDEEEYYDSEDGVRIPPREIRQFFNLEAREAEGDSSDEDSVKAASKKKRKKTKSKKKRNEAAATGGAAEPPSEEEDGDAVPQFMKKERNYITHEGDSSVLAFFKCLFVCLLFVYYYLIRVTAKGTPKRK